MIRTRWDRRMPVCLGYCFTQGKLINYLMVNINLYQKLIDKTLSRRQRKTNHSGILPTNLQILSNSIP